jgi:pimeloyl-ACP methyl ester carboxylesterase
MRYLEAGSGSPLVLLHAFPLSADMWRPQLERVPRGWRMLAPDLRGFGPAGSQAKPAVSEAAHPTLTVAEMAGDIIAWLDAIGVERAVIGGLSMGGYVTFALFNAIPERFSGLLLANTKATADTPQARSARDKMAALVRERGPSAVADDMIPKLLGDTSRRTRAPLADTVRGLIESNRAEGLEAAIYALKERPDSTDILPRVDRPVLVIAGEEDTIIPPSESQAMHESLPNSQLVVLPRAGHLSSLESPDEFSTALSNFLQARRTQG